MTNKYMIIKDQQGAVLYEGLDEKEIQPSIIEKILYYSVCIAVLFAGALFISYIADMGA